MTSTLEILEQTVRQAEDAENAAEQAFRDWVAAEDLLTETEDATALVRQVAAACQQTVHAKLAGVVSEFQAAVYQDPYIMEISFEEKRGKTEALLRFVRDGELFELEEVGGGPVDLAAVGLRLACVASGRPASRRLLVLDEPFRFVGKANAPALRGVMEMLAEQMGFQIIMVTHSDELHAGKVVRFG